MPIKIPDNLPAKEVLAAENVFIMNEKRAEAQDIRPLEILLLNLMPTKVQTETQFLRLLGNSPLQTEITLLHPSGHVSKNTPEEHLLNFYKTFPEIKNRRFDGMIITGAPIEQMEFEEVDYWAELVEIMDWAEENVFSTLFVCWGAQAGLYHHFQIPKHPLAKKISGIYPHYLSGCHSHLLTGFDEEFFVPHSRYTEVRREDILKNNSLKILAESEQAGVYLVIAEESRQVFITGHSEYATDTLKLEYDRDIGQCLEIEIPENYFPDNDPRKKPVARWKSHAYLLFSNWLNYYVYQDTPFDLSKLNKKAK